jgi:energy-coupling factor transporter ATP-binding protein EcfA2
MQLDPNNKEFNRAANLVLNTHHNVFLTGKAGTGKTTFLHHIREQTSKKIAVVAPTGIAAINAKGATIHSLFQVPPQSVFTPDDQRLKRKSSSDKTSIYNTFKYSRNKKTLLEELDLLIIDEVSMVRCDLLDVIDKILKAFGGGSSSSPFGGKQVLLIGDPFQLPPIAKEDEWDILGRYYDSPYFFSANSFKSRGTEFVELKKIYRQKGDQTFINLLNRSRVGKATLDDISLLNAKVSPNFEFKNEGYVYLATHKILVQDTNQRELDSLPSRLITYQGTVTGKFKEGDMPTLKELKLKKGAQVMFVKNDSSREKRYYNGMIATVDELEENKIFVRLPNQDKILVEKTTWERIKYQWDEKEKKVKEIRDGSFTQFPIKLAWAITIHKSQGLTFEKVYASIDGSFTHGQAYVALSRCTSLKGLKLESSIDKRVFIVDEEVLEFYNEFLDKVSDEEETVQVDGEVAEEKGKTTTIAEDEEVFEPTPDLEDIEKDKEPDPPPKPKEKPEPPPPPPPPLPLPQILYFKSSKPDVSGGESIVLEWRTENAIDVRISNIGRVEPFGSRRITPERDMEFQLLAKNGDGKEIRSHLIRVSTSKKAPRIIEFRSNYQYALPGTPATLRWKVDGAKEVEIQPEIGKVETEGEIGLLIEDTVIVKLIARSHYGVQSSQRLQVMTLPPPVIEKIIVPEIEVDASISLSIKPTSVIDEFIFPELEDLTIKAPEIPSIDLDNSLNVEQNYYLQSNKIKAPVFRHKKIILQLEKLLKIIFSNNPKRKQP